MTSASENRLATFEEVLAKLAGEDEPPTELEVAGLSNPTPANLEHWRAVWPTVDPVRRQAIADAMVESAVDSFQVNYRPLFEAMLDDEDGEVRRAGIDGLFEAEDLALMDRFVAMAANDLHPAVRGHAATALGRFLWKVEMGEVSEHRVRQAIEVVLNLAQDESEEIEVRQQAVASAGFIDRPEVRNILEDALASDEPLLIAGALRGMGNSADDAWGPQIIEWLEANDLRLVREAVRAVGELGYEPAVTPLAFLTDTEDLDFLAEIIWALGEIGGKKAKRVLERLEGPVEAADDEVLTETYEDALATLALNEGLIDTDPLGRNRPGSRGSAAAAIDGTDDDLRLDAWLDEGALDEVLDDEDELDALDEELESELDLALIDDEEGDEADEWLSDEDYRSVALSDLADWSDDEVEDIDALLDDGSLLDEDPLFDDEGDEPESGS